MKKMTMLVLFGFLGVGISSPALFGQTPQVIQNGVDPHWDIPGFMGKFWPALSNVIKPVNIPAITFVGSNSSTIIPNCQSVFVPNVGVPANRADLQNYRLIAKQVARFALPCTRTDEDAISIGLAQAVADRVYKNFGYSDTHIPDTELFNNLPLEGAYGGLFAVANGDATTASAGLFEVLADQMPNGLAGIVDALNQVQPYNRRTFFAKLKATGVNVNGVSPDTWLSQMEPLRGSLAPASGDFIVAYPNKSVNPDLFTVVWGTNLGNGRSQFKGGKIGWEIRTKGGLVKNGVEETNQFVIKNIFPLPSLGLAGYQMHICALKTDGNCLTGPANETVFYFANWPQSQLARGAHLVFLQGPTFTDYTTQFAVRVVGDSSTNLQLSPDGGLAIISGVTREVAVSDGQIIQKFSPLKDDYTVHLWTWLSHPILTNVLNAASFDTFNPKLAPGGYYSAFGQYLCRNDPEKAATLPLVNKSCGGKGSVVLSQPFFGEVWQGSILYWDTNQVNFQIPWNVPIHKGFALFIKVVLNGEPSPGLGYPAEVFDTDPAIFSVDFGSKLGAVADQGGQIKSASNPAKVGEVLTVYATGCGLTNPSVTDAGQATPSDKLYLTQADTQVKVDGLPAEVLFSGLAPGFAGLCQVNFRVPDLPAGTNSTVDLALEMKGLNQAAPATSNIVKLPVTR